MGTNYYAVGKPCDRACDHCTAPRRVHVCKSLASFRAYSINPFDDDPSEPLLTWPQWRDALQQYAVAIEDEYGSAPDSVADFIQRVESTSREGRGRQFDWYRDNLDVADSVWQDAHGFSFSLREFS